VQTILGLSITSTGVAWVLVDAGEDDTLDHDAFATRTSTSSTSQLAAAARGAQAIATASGHTVRSIGVTWSENVDIEGTRLLESLTDLGYDNVVAVRPAQAARSFAQRIGRGTGYEKTAVCIVEPDAVTVVAADINEGTARTAVTSDVGTAAGLIRWLTTLFNRRGWQSDALFLIGSHTTIDAVKARLEADLPMRVFASGYSQLALAKGAAPASTDPDVAAKKVGAGGLPHVRPWLLSRSEALTALASCVIAVLAAVLLLPKDDSRPVADPPAANTSAPPASVATGPPPASAPPAPQLSRVDEPLPTPELQVTQAATHSVPGPQQNLADEQPANPATPAAQEPVAPPTVAPAAVLEPPPPPDPIQGMLSPLFSALP
jgi:hypothetical protein